ncbi:MAG: glycoside hydrolase family 9 protein [Promethearchaeota archaeon]
MKMNNTPSRSIKKRGSGLRLDKLNNNKIFSLIILINVLISAAVITYKIIPKKEDPTMIIVNPVGYLSMDKNKTFLLKTEEPITSVSFRIINESNNKEVYSGNTTYLGKLWDYYYSLGNFTEFNAEGNYTIRIDLHNRIYESYDFEISDKVYLSFIDLLYKFFYYQRCGTKVFDNVVPGYKGHEPCHLDDAINEHNSSEYINLTGGWHDAGDYNKYHSTTSISELGLALSYKNGEKYFNSKDLCDDYPVYKDYSYQSDDISDLLEEIIWGADYLVKTIRENGSVIDAVGSNDQLGWYGFGGPPSLETDGDPNTTADNRIFKPNVGYAGMKTAAALLSVAEILNSTDLPSVIRNKLHDRMQKYFNVGQKVRNYYYSDPKSSLNGNWAMMADQMLADMSLFELTQNTTYKEEADFIGWHFMVDDKYDFKNPGFGHIGIDQVPAKLFYWARFNGSAAVKNELASKLEDHYRYFWYPLSNMNYASNYFRLLMGNTSYQSRGTFYFWDYTSGGWNVGQNSYYAVAAWAAILAYNLTSDYKYLDFALRQIDWICGKNPFSLTMIEGAGDKNMEKYHNRASSINGNSRGAIPGCVPNGIIREHELRPGASTLADAPWYDSSTLTIEADHAEYMSNEPWIPHNSNMLLAISALYRYGLSYIAFI